mmetsp:Transcript_8830/g.29041  ORF Transcript_8830/g.29041 Transcript_8830/m.29041 type:complete len:206 (-) Transcript_8830:462-1079(-)
MRVRNRAEQPLVLGVVLLPLGGELFDRWLHERRTLLQKRPVLLQALRLGVHELVALLHHHLHVLHSLHELVEPLIRRRSAKVRLRPVRAALDRFGRGVNRVRRVMELHIREGEVVVTHGDELLVRLRRALRGCELDAALVARNRELVPERARLARLRRLEALPALILRSLGGRHLGRRLALLARDGRATLDALLALRLFQVLLRH